MSLEGEKTIVECKFPLHSRILAEVEDSIKEINKGMKEREKELDTRCDKHMVSLWTEVRGKLSSRIALVIFCAFTLSYITGMFTMYKGIQNNRIMVINAVNGLKLDIKDVKNDIKVIKHDLKKGGRNGH